MKLDARYVIIGIAIIASVALVVWWLRGGAMSQPPSAPAGSNPMTQAPE